METSAPEVTDAEQQCRCGAGAEANQDDLRHHKLSRSLAGAVRDGTSAPTIGRRADPGVLVFRAPVREGLLDHVRQQAEGSANA